MNNPELDDMLGVVDGDEENECRRCHCLYLLRDGEFPTKYCDQCAHEIIIENDL
jgi:hypothetical protein